MCAMSVITSAPTSSATARTRAKSNTRGYALAPTTIIFGLCSRARRCELVVVEPLVFLPHAVRDDLEVLAREIQRVAVREVAAVREVHAEHRVARLEHGDVDGHVGLRAGVRLDVDVLGAEQLLRAIDRERLGDVDELAAAVVALARIAFGVLVRHHRAGRLEHGEADEVLGRDQLEAFFLASDFVADGGGDFGIDGVEMRHSIMSTRDQCHALEGPNLVDAALVPSAGKRRVEERVDDLAGGVGWREALAEREDVGVVVLAAQTRRLLVRHRGGADARDLVGGDRHADAPSRRRGCRDRTPPTRPRARPSRRRPDSRPTRSSWCRSP